MKCMIVDDESIARLDLERQLLKIGGVEIVGKFSNAADALEALSRFKTDILFLDIEMPEISGLEAAVLAQDVQPSIQIVFVTAYQGFAVKAFELQAIDYLLKPVQVQRLIQTLQRLDRTVGTTDAYTDAAAQNMVNIRCLGQMSVEYGLHGASLPWRTNKAQELFAFLVHRRNQMTRKDMLVELLWPDTDPARAYSLLYTIVYQLRKSLDAAGLAIRIVNNRTGYELQYEDCKIDIDEWEKDNPGDDRLTLQTSHVYESWLEAYTGDYFEDHDYDWAGSERRRLRTLWYRHAMRLGQLWAAEGRTAAALDWYYRIQTRFPYEEEVFFAILKLHGELGEMGFVEQQYLQLVQMSENQFGLPPSAEITQWYIGLRPSSSKQHVE